MELGLHQKELLIRRSRLTTPTLRACAAVCVDEPLFRILSSCGVDAQNLYGWAAYAQALAHSRQRNSDSLINLQMRRQGEQEKVRSITFAVAQSMQAQAVVAELNDQELQLQTEILAIGREQKAIEREMVEEFWKVYQAAAVKLVQGVDEAHAPYLRAFLRHGLLGCSARFIQPQLARRLLTECAAAPAEPVYRGQATQVFHADELIELVSRGLIPPSPNEDLELNHSNTPQWRADRACAG